MANQKVKHTYFLLLFYLTITFGLCSCGGSKEVEDPCDWCCPEASGINSVTFKNTNNEILEQVNFEEVDQPCYSLAYRDSYDPEETSFSIYFNDYYPFQDLDHFQMEPLFNGAIKFEILLTMMDSTLSELYEIDRLQIRFMNGYYGNYQSIYDTNSVINISKYGDVWKKIEGSFISTFINNGNNADTLIVECQFSADRWCDR